MKICPISVSFGPKYKFCGIVNPLLAARYNPHRQNGMLLQTLAKMKTQKIFSPCPTKPHWLSRTLSTFVEDPELKEFKGYMEKLKNYEKEGVPKGAGTDSDVGFDLRRMRRLMVRLGNPQTKFKAVHIAGTKGKGSTAAFISSILRTEGYSVGSYTSPHIQTIRERMCLGKFGEPVSAKVLNHIFCEIKENVDQAMELENESFTHFEVLTAMAFTLFAHEKVDIAVIEAGLGGARDATNIICSSELALSVITTIGEEHLSALGGSLESIAKAKSGIIKYGCPLVLGGPFLPHIEHILRHKATSVSSPVVSASDPRNISSIKGLGINNDKPCQCCDIMIHIERDFHLSIDLHGVNLCMPGVHQLQNAVTATCAALCLREQRWRISDKSIRAGLEDTFLLGRSHFLTPKEAKALGLPGATILLDGAHTKESARALTKMVQMMYPNSRSCYVVSMASDKDHLAFARELLSGSRLEAVFLTETDIAGAKSRTTSSSSLRDCWIRASKELGIDSLHHQMEEYHQFIENPSCRSDGKLGNKTLLVADDSMLHSMKVSDEILRSRAGDRPGVIVVTGSLHAVSSVLASLPPP